jgi:flagellin
LASNGHLTANQRELLNSEFNQLRSDIDRLAQATTYNGQILLAGENEAVVDQSTVLSNSADNGVVGHNVSGAEPGTYVFTDSPADALITLENGENSQQVNLGTLLDAGVIPEGVKVRVNFDRLGLQVTLSGGDPGGGGQYQAGDLDGATLEVKEGVGGSFQVGPDNEDFDRLVVDLPDLRASSTTLNLGKAAVTSQSTARSTIALVDQAISRISAERGRLGALQNRLGFTLSYSENEIENLQLSDSSIRDADMAHESTRLSRFEILANTGSAMMVQAFDNARLSLLLL